MTHPAATSCLTPEREHGKPPIVCVDAFGDAARWAAEHRDALRAAVTEHGSLLVRGLALHDPAETEAVFRELGALTTEREAFAQRHIYAPGVYSASKVRVPNGGEERGRDSSGRRGRRARGASN